MKTSTVVLAALMALGPVLGLSAEEPAMKCPMCEMMKKKQAAAAQQAKRDLMVQAEELDKLLTAMNGSLGTEKMEAVSALLTRLVEMNKRMAKQLAQLQTAPARPKDKKGSDSPAAGDGSAEGAPTAEPPKEAPSEHDHH